MIQYHNFSVVTIFIAQVALLMAELSGENVCHKKEIYTVTMRVLVKEPVQVKSYTWCLKVPPRCTKYKIEMRDKFKIQTELRERVLDVCCIGYAPDYTQSHCLPICNGCLHGVCATTDSCTCEPGYTGKHCEIECQRGFWGAECGEWCHCQNGALCHHVTGECQCADGWQGILCDTPCPNGTYGHSCTKQCNCTSGDKNKFSTCHHISGNCLSANDHNTNHYFETTVTSQASTPNESDKEIEERHFNNHEEETTTVHNVFTTMRTFETANITFTAFTTKTSIVVTETLPQSNKETTVIPSSTDILTNTKTVQTSPSPPLLKETTVEPTAPTSILKKERAEDNLVNNSVANPFPTDRDDDYTEDEIHVNEVVNSNSTDLIKPQENSQTTEEAEKTEPQNIYVPPHGVIVVSDGLSANRDEEDKIGDKDSKSGVWDLVSSVIIAGGVALAIIVTAIVTLLVAHSRNRTKVTITENKAESSRVRHTEQQTHSSRPQMYNYSEDVNILPIQHLFPDVSYSPASYSPHSEGLQLKHGNVTNILNANNNHGLPFQSHSDMKAFMELQYDIPPASRVKSLQSELEPEHLYDEIPCLRSSVTASTNTDISLCRQMIATTSFINAEKNISPCEQIIGTSASKHSDNFYCEQGIKIYTNTDTDIPSYGQEHYAMTYNNTDIYINCHGQEVDTTDCVSLNTSQTNNFCNQERIDTTKYIKSNKNMYLHREKADQVALTNSDTSYC